MFVPIYDQLVLPFTRMLGNLDKILTTAEADAETRKIDPEVYLNARLAPDMLPLIQHVQIMTEMAKGGAGRLVGLELPIWPKEEKTFADLRTRIRTAIDYLKSFEPGQFEGTEARVFEKNFGRTVLKVTGKEYLVGFVIPNFYFHYTTAYLILRHNGVQIGKWDYLGKLDDYLE